MRHLLAVHSAPVRDGFQEELAPHVHAGRRLGSNLALRVATAVLGVSFLVQGGPALATPERLAAFLRVPGEPHAYRELGIVAIAIGLATTVAAIRPGLLRVAVSVAVPAGLALGVFGLSEMGHAANPGAEMVHVGQGVLAAILGVLWIPLRDASRTRPKDTTGSIGGEP